MPYLELIAGLVCIAGFGFVLAEVIFMPYPQSFWDGPGAVPTVLSIFVILLSIFWVSKTILQKVYVAKNANKKEPLEVVSNKKGRTETRNLISIILLTLCYIAILIRALPFPIATFVFVFLAVQLFAKIRWIYSLLIASITAILIFAIFEFILHLPMPH